MKIVYVSSVGVSETECLVLLQMTDDEWRALKDQGIGFLRGGLSEEARRHLSECLIDETEPE